MTETWLYHDSSTVKVETDLTTKYWPNQIVKITQTTDKFFKVVSATYSAPYTYLALDGDGLYTIDNATITSHSYSMFSAPEGMPAGMFVPVPSALTSLDNDVTQAAGKHIATDEIRARAGTMGLKLDGTDDWIDAGAVDLGGNAVSFEFLLTMDEVPEAYLPGLVAYHPAAGYFASAGSLQLAVNPPLVAGTNPIHWGFGDGLSPNFGFVDHVAFGVQVHIVITHDVTNEEAKVYIDGVLVATLDITGAPAIGTAFDLEIAGGRGTSPPGDAPLGCILNRARVWTRILTPTEAEDAYNGDTVSDTDLVLHYDFSEGEGDTLTDLSGEGNDGTLEGFADTSAGAGNDPGTSGWMSSEVAVGPNVSVAGRLWVGGDVICEELIDRCVWSDVASAIDAIKPIRGDGEGGLDHSSLPDCARVRLSTKNIIEVRPVLDKNGKPKLDDKGDPIVETVKVGEEIEEGRDLGAMVSLLTQAFQEMAARVESLESAQRVTK